MELKNCANVVYFRFLKICAVSYPVLWMHIKFLLKLIHEFFWSNFFGLRNVAERKKIAYSFSSWTTPTIFDDTIKQRPNIYWKKIYMQYDAFFTNILFCIIRADSEPCILLIQIKPFWIDLDWRLHTYLQIFLIKFF